MTHSRSESYVVERRPNAISQVPRHCSWIDKLAVDQSIMILCHRDFQNELISAECESLTGVRPIDGVTNGGRAHFVADAAYLHTAIQVFAQEKALKALLKTIKAAQLELDEFCIELLNLSQDSKIQHRQTVIDVADAIPYRPNLNYPAHRLIVVVQDSGFTFGEVLTRANHSYLRHRTKPFHTSSSLPAQLARGLVNLVRPYANTIIDPCCGTGSILLEAQAIGIAVTGGDWNRKMVQMSETNLEHFGYKGRVLVKDAERWVTSADAVVTNLPYGKNLKASEKGIRDILARVVGLAPVGVFVTTRDITGWLEAAGYMDVEVYRVPKSPRFVRFVHLAYVTRHERAMARTIKDVDSAGCMEVNTKGGRCVESTTGETQPL